MKIKVENYSKLEQFKFNKFKYFNKLFDLNSEGIYTFTAKIDINKEIFKNKNYFNSNLNLIVKLLSFNPFNSELTE